MLMVLMSSNVPVATLLATIIYVVQRNVRQKLPRQGFCDRFLLEISRFHHFTPSVDEYLPKFASWPRVLVGLLDGRCVYETGAEAIDILFVMAPEQAIHGILTEAGDVEGLREDVDIHCDFSEGPDVAFPLVPDQWIHIIVTWVARVHFEDPSRAAG
jgi:hypothetical protein